MKKKKPSFPRRLVKKIDFENFTQKIVDSSCKNIKQIGQFYVTLICSLFFKFTHNRMILFVKTSEVGDFFFDTIWSMGRLIVRVISSKNFEGRDENIENL